jgi:hypothetical protein
MLRTAIGRSGKSFSLRFLFSGGDEKCDWQIGEGSDPSIPETYAEDAQIALLGPAHRNTPRKKIPRHCVQDDRLCDGSEMS